MRDGLKKFVHFVLRNPAKGREVDLDFIRGIAIFLAIGWHFNRSSPSGVANEYFLPGYSFGWAGVDLFFVLSGFIVGRVILKEIARTGSMDISAFFIRRSLKLWPSLYIFISLLIVWAPWNQFLFQIGFHVQNYFRTPIATHLWSLAVEEHFYAVSAFLVPFYFCKIGSKRGFSIILAFILLFVVLLRIVAWNLGVSPDTLQIQTQYRIDALACGVLLASIAVFWPDKFDALLKHRILWSVLSVAGICFLISFPKSTPVGCTVGYSVAYLASASALLAVYRSGVEARIPWICRPLAWMGLYSYAIYIWHVPAEKLLDRFILGGLVSNPVIVIALNYAAAIFAGFLMTRIIERPCLAVRDRILEKRKATPPYRAVRYAPREVAPENRTG